MTTVPCPMVVRSWAHNANESDVAALAEALATRSSDITGVDLILCPPFASLTDVRATVGDTGIAIGAPVIRDKHGGQDADGIAASILANRCEYVVVGHWLWEETVATVASETEAALRHGICPILCVWDIDAHHRKREPIEVTMQRQIQGALSLVNFELSPRSLAIAYVPAWTIETGRTLPVERASDILATIRKVIIQRLGEESAASVPLLYGGRIDPDDADAFAAATGIDGILAIDDDIEPADFIQVARAFSAASPHREQNYIPSSVLQSGRPAADDIEQTPEQQAVSLLLKRSLLPIISELEDALQYLADREAQGLQLIQEKLKEFQQWEKISRVGELFEEFDPDVHRAVGTDERGEHPSRTVVEVVRPGYRIEGNVVQKAEVIVNR